MAAAAASVTAAGVQPPALPLPIPDTGSRLLSYLQVTSICTPELAAGTSNVVDEALGGQAPYYLWLEME